MTTPNEIGQIQETPTYPPAPSDYDDSPEPLSLFQEINARRARVENVELLQHLRGL